MSLRRAEREPEVPRGIFNVELYPNGGSFVRKFIKPSGLIPTLRMLLFISTGAEREPSVHRGIKPDSRIKTRLYLDLNKHIS